MTEKEKQDLSELIVYFTQASMDRKYLESFKNILKQTDFNGVFVQLYYVTFILKPSDPRAKELFEILGIKINARDNEEYGTFIKEQVRQHLGKNGLI